MNVLELCIHLLFRNAVWQWQWCEVALCIIVLTIHQYILHAHDISPHLPRLVYEVMGALSFSYAVSVYQRCIVKLNEIKGRSIRGFRPATNNLLGSLSPLTSYTPYPYKPISIGFIMPAIQGQIVNGAAESESSLSLSIFSSDSHSHSLDTLHAPAF